jgi:ribosomal protein L37AE/L43A
MSKTKNRTHSQAEHLQGEIKRLKSENRNLRKRLKELEKWDREVPDPLEEPEVVIPDVLSCPECKDGTLEFHDFVQTQLLICDNCDYREKANAKEKETKNTRTNVNTKASRGKSVVATKKRGQKPR